MSTLLCFVACTLMAQERSIYNFGSSIGENQSDRMIEVDTTLFRMPISHSFDPYAQATQYYRAQGTSRRRGLYYTTAQQIVEPAKEYLLHLEEPLPYSQVALYAAQSNYRVGLRASHAQMLKSGWSMSSSLWTQTGRDMFVEGVFRNTFAPQITLNRRFSANHYLSLDFDLYYSMRGLQSGSTPEAFGLIGSNYYNPSWGFYNGKVRNARARRDFTPALKAHYQRSLNNQTKLAVEASVDYSRQANSSLGWYDASTPTPDYYRKMPSFMTAGEVQDYVTTLWRTNDTDYTQVNWDELVRLNSLSADGNAYYTLEDRVEQLLTASFAVVAHSELSQRLVLSYGVLGEVEQSRNFKVMRDLLGATHLVDYDIFMGDSYNKTMPLQNNLLNADNYIYEGDRFGYDYSQNHSAYSLLLRAQYRASRFDFDVEATIGAESFYREGHFEKERFPSSASYGSSSIVSLSPYTLRASMGYAAHANKYFALKVVSSRLSPLSRNLFLNESAANYLSTSLTGELINSASFAFRLNYPTLLLSGEVYALRSSDGASVYSLYDDLSSTMCRAVISDIGYSSYGVEVTAEFRLHRNLRFTSTLAAGRYYYNSDPSVELFDDYDLITISSPTPSRMSGVNIGNTPQIAATTSLTYFGFKRCIIGLSSSYSALRYEQPSIARRSERLFAQAFVNDESATEAIAQQRLDDIFDVEVSVNRSFYFENGGRLSVRLSVRNLLGDSDRVVYARESDRVILQSVDDYFTGATMRESSLQYGLPRTAQLSVSYLF